MRGSNKIKLFIGFAIIVFGLFKYCSSAEINPYTNKKQHITITEEQEVAMGLQAAPKMAQQHGGLHPNNHYQAYVDQVGKKLVTNSVASQTPYRYEFHLLADPNTINAFALPGGQIFITYALFSQLKNEDQLAGILGHEIGHVVGRHSADQISKQGLADYIINGVGVAFDPNTAQGAAAIANMLNMKYGREDELESDDLGVRFMIDANYNPDALIDVMKILKAAAGPNRVPEFQSTHPDPENRIQHIENAIKKYKR